MQYMVDVVISVFGKPYQTLCTLKSLLKHSGQHIDKIFFLEEKHHAYDDEVKWVMDKFENIIHNKPEEYYGNNPFIVSKEQMATNINRYNFRYQYGIENSDKKHIFITHNDMLYTGDIIGNMMNEINGSTGIGLIGQCWNCPAFKADKCDGDRFNDYNPSYDEVQEMMKIHGGPVRHHFYQWLDKDKENVMPMPECRLNEFACIIDREVTVKECYPKGDARLFGAMELLDTGSGWFRDMCLKGYKFKNYDINKDSYHGCFSNIEEREYSKGKKFFVSGYQTQLHEEIYWLAEDRAKKYYEQNFKL